MGYPKHKYSKKDSVLVTSEEHEKELGKEYHDSPVDAEADYEYEGKGQKKEKKAEKPVKDKNGEKV